MAHKDQRKGAGRVAGSIKQHDSRDPSHRPKGHNTTVHEMTTQQDDVHPYVFTKEQADAIARKRGWQNEGESFLNGDTAKELQSAGGLDGKLARHIAKWLTDPGSQTTIPLTAAEHKELAKLGATLETP